MINCREATYLVSSRTERKLALKEIFGLRLHLMMCRNCTAFEKNLNALRAATKAFSLLVEKGERLNGKNHLPEEKKREILSLIEREGKGGEI